MRSWVPSDLNLSTLLVLTKRRGASSERNLNDLSGKGRCPSVRACNLAQFCDLGYQLSSLAELLPVTVARGEKAQFLIVRVAGSIPT